MPPRRTLYMAILSPVSILDDLLETSRAVRLDAGSVASPVARTLLWSEHACAKTVAALTEDRSALLLLDLRVPAWVGRCLDRLAVGGAHALRAAVERTDTERERTETGHKER